MNLQIPTYISAIFLFLVFLLFFLLLNGFKYALNKIKYSEKRKRIYFLMLPLGLSIWLIALAILSLTGFFKDFSTVPPRFIFAIAPPIILIFIGVFFRPFKYILFQIPPQHIISLQSFRILMEIILWLLFVNQIIPVQMTFEGLNFDIVAGITAPIVAYLAFNGRRYKLKLALAWNFISMALLINIVVIAILSAPTAFRVFMNEPSNTVIAYYPFIWLPGFVVPIAFFLHLASIRQILLLLNNSHRKNTRRNSMI